VATAVKLRRAKQITRSKISNLKSQVPKESQGSNHKFQRNPKAQITKNKEEIHCAKSQTKPKNKITNSNSHEPKKNLKSPDYAKASAGEANHKFQRNPKAQITKRKEKIHYATTQPNPKNKITNSKSKEPKKYKEPGSKIQRKPNHKSQ
jgi:hypothetical protein